LTPEQNICSLFRINITTFNQNYGIPPARELTRPLAVQTAVCKLSSPRFGVGLSANCPVTDQDTGPQC